MKLRSIQTLRAAAAIGVVIYHVTKGRFWIGPAGVDLFFVISGFIMATVSPGRTAGKFFVDRLWRILPLYFVCLAAIVPLVLIERNYCQDMASLTLWPVWGEFCAPYLVPAWTLSLELMFYAFVAVTIGQPSRLFALMLALVILGRVYASPLTAFIGHPMMLEFLMGFAIARLPLHRRAGLWALPAALALSVLLSLLDLGEMERVFVWGMPAAAIVYAALSLEEYFAHRAFVLPVLLGDASYSIYLAHFPILALNFDLWFVGAYVAVLGGYLVYRVIERPMMSYRSKRRVAGAPIGIPAVTPTA